MPSRYIIGIDLGTTNTSVSFVDTDQQGLKCPVEIFRIPQCIDLGSLRSEPLIPSCCYLSQGEDWPKDSFPSMWQHDADYVLGKVAEKLGMDRPNRLVVSAKSWLSAAAKQQGQTLLPLDAEQVKITPVEALSRILLHIQKSWDATLGKKEDSALFSAQQVILTVPASFDEVSRTLTVQAAVQAGYQHLTLLEEPQAAFYSWLMRHEKDWDKYIQPGDCVLVCDVGGGTTDFSLIHVEETEQGPQFKRMSVGRHLLLGGDNMDEALCHWCEQKYQEQGLGALSSKERAILKRELVIAKEALFQPEYANKKIDSISVLIKGTSSSIIKQSKRIEVHLESIRQYLLDGFFKYLSVPEALEQMKNTGLKSYGLPYERSALITAHLATFLTQAQAKDHSRLPTHILFNGGCMKPAPFQQAIVRCVSQWYGIPPLKIIHNASFDLAVSQGAAYYGKAQRGLGIRIWGGFPRGFYLKLADAGAQKNKAMVLLARGALLGTHYTCSQEFFIIPNTPVSFEILASDTRLDDKQEEVVSIVEDEMTPLWPLYTTIRYGKVSKDPIRVKLDIALTETGLLELSLRSMISSHQWKLEFQLRGESGQESRLSHLTQKGSREVQVDEKIENDVLKDVKNYLKKIYSRDVPIKEVLQLSDSLERKIEIPKENWTASILRALSDSLLEVHDKRQISKEHEAKWWNILGYSLRPGCGSALDDYRMKQVWNILLSESSVRFSTEVLAQRWIAFRRLAGGLGRGQQNQLAREMLEGFMSKRSKEIIFSKKESLHVYSERIRCLGSFEQLDVSLKQRLGSYLVARIQGKDPMPAEFWALSRIAARNLCFAPPSYVVPSSVCLEWFLQLTSCTERLFQEMNQAAFFSIDQSPLLAILCRMVEAGCDKSLDLPADCIHRFYTKYPEIKSWIALQKDIHSQSLMYRQEILLDSLPSGIALACNG